MSDIAKVDIKFTEGSTEKTSYDTGDRFDAHISNMDATNFQAIKDLLNAIDAGTDVSSVVTAIDAL